MAETKKATAKVIAKAAPAKTVEVKKEEVKEAVKVATPAAEVKAPEKAAPAKAVEKKAPAKKAAAEKKAPAKKAVAEKKAPAKKAATEKKAPAKKAAVKVQESVNFQFSGKSYTDADLLKICRDVWKYDLNGKEEDLKTVELYVKPEENTTYYVINGSITGSFFI
ncbi:MAG: DUF6465 family protein [Suilimivivens sp.]